MVIRFLLWRPFVQCSERYTSYFFRVDVKFESRVFSPLLCTHHPLLFSKLFQPEYTFADGDGTVPSESAMVQQKHVITQFSLN